MACENNGQKGPDLRTKNDTEITDSAQSKLSYHFTVNHEV